MRDWIVPICTVLGLLGNWAVVTLANGRSNARREGIVDEKLKVANARILKAEVAVEDQGQRIATIEGQLAGLAPAHRR
jgi:hypothetical protein